MHAMILALPESDVSRDDSRTVPGRDNQLGYIAAGNRCRIVGILDGCTIHLMAALHGVPIMSSRTGRAESYADEEHSIDNTCVG
jgi:hypothetical protein